jgi:hypothetical protein
MTSYTLILSTGTHYVDVPTGEAILSAIRDGAIVVTVDIDWVGDGFTRKNVHLSTAHIVALILNAEDADFDEIPFGPNVAAFRLRKNALR